MREWSRGGSGHLRDGARLLLHLAVLVPGEGLAHPLGLELLGLVAGVLHSLPLLLRVAVWKKLLGLALVLGCVAMWPTWERAVVVLPLPLVARAGVWGMVRRAAGEADLGAGVKLWTRN